MLRPGRLRESKRAASAIATHKTISRGLTFVQAMAFQLFRSDFEDLVALRLVVLAVGVRLSDSPSYPCKKRVAFEECGLNIPIFKSANVLDPQNDA